MKSQTDFQGIYPSPPVVYTDETCREIDFESYQAHLSFLLDHDIAGLCIGGHAGETECLSLAERLKVIDAAIEVTKGRVPVIAGVIADATWDAIEQIKAQRDHGADAFLVCPPNIVGWDAATADAMLLAHFGAIDREGRAPFMVYGGPGDGSSCRQLPETMRKTAEECGNLVAWKIAVRGISTGENSFAACVAALKKAEAKTGRAVSPLIAGDADFVGALEAGGKGNVNACESVRVEDNTKIYAAFQRGDVEGAREIQNRCMPIANIVYGVRLGRSFTYFHYRFKIATWMLGRIPNAFMRLPQVPPPADEISMIHEALIAAGKEPVRSPRDFNVSQPSRSSAA